MDRTYHLDITWLLKFACDERTHLWMLLPSGEGRSRCQTEVKVSTSWFTECSLASLIVKDIVDKLKK
jgi:hypothetical protein